MNKFQVSRANVIGPGRVVEADWFEINSNGDLAFVKNERNITAYASGEWMLITILEATND